MATSTALQLTKVKPVARVLIEAATSLIVRTWQPFGRSEGSHLLVLEGAFVVEWLGLLVRGKP